MISLSIKSEQSTSCVRSGVSVTQTLTILCGRCVVQMMDFALEMMGFVFKMMNFVLKMTNQCIRLQFFLRWPIVSWSIFTHAICCQTCSHPTVRFRLLVHLHRRSLFHHNPNERLGDQEVKDQQDRFRSACIPSRATWIELHKLGLRRQQPPFREDKVVPNKCAHERHEAWRYWLWVTINTAVETLV